MAARLAVDNRGVSGVVGFIFVFAILLILLSINQAQVVPAENEQVEYRHSQAVLGQLQELRNSVLAAAGSGSTSPVSVELGTQYPSRVFAVNPPPASGSLRTVAVGTPPNVTIENAVAQDAEIADYWDGRARSFETRSIVYQPNYHAYDGAQNSTIYENSVLYSRFDSGGTVAETDQVLVRDRTITLVAVDGELSRSGSQSVSVDPRAISGPYQEVTIGNDDPGPIEITLPSSIGAGTFSEMVDLPAYASVTDGANGQLVLSLDPGPYTLRMAKVGVGSGTTAERAQYVRSVEGLPEQVLTGSSHEIRVGVNDRFNTPVSSVPVSGSATAGTLDAAQKLTDSAGTASFTYTAPDTPGTATVDLSIFDGVPDAELVSEDTTVTAGGTGPQPPTDSFASTVVDQGQTGSLARYEISFDATGISDYNRTEVTIQNLDAAWADATYVSSNERDNLDDYGWTNTFGGTGGDSYQITLVVYDDTGSVVDSRTVTDVADGVDPGGNEALSEADSPTLDSAQLSEVGQNTVEYELEYAVSDPAGKFSEVEALFLNRDSPYATDEITGTALADTVSYSGYSMGDRYQVFVQVQDDDGIVVDQRLINDTAGKILEADRSVPVQSGDRLQFDIRNTGDSLVTITDFAIDATPLDTNVFVDDGPENELEIRGGFWATGAANRDPGEFAADGTQYNLIFDSNTGGQYGYLLEEDDEVTVEFAEFTGPGASDRSLDDLVFADSAADADVTVTFYLSGGDPQAFYFQQA